MCRGSLAWLGRQTHNLEIIGAKRLIPEVTGSNPVPGTTFLPNSTTENILSNKARKQSQNSRIDKTIDNKTAKNSPCKK